MNLLLAAISGQSLINLVIWLVIVGLIYFVVDWALKKIALPEPFGKVAYVLLVLVTAILVINGLLGLVDRSFIRL